jgi:hypothetical protein
MARTKFSAIKRAGPLASSNKERNSDSESAEQPSPESSEINRNEVVLTDIKAVLVTELSTVRTALTGAVGAIDRILVAIGYLPATGTELSGNNPVGKRPTKTVSATATKEPLYDNFNPSSASEDNNFECEAIELCSTTYCCSVDKIAVEGRPATSTKVRASRPTPFHSISAQSKRSELFVTHVHRSTSVRDLQDYVSHIPNVTVERISHANARFQSFVLTVPMDHINNVLDFNFWPRGIECRRFHRPISGRLAVRGC